VAGSTRRIRRVEPGSRYYLSSGQERTMGFDSGTAERVRRVAAELAVAHTGDRSTRAAFLERAIEAVDRLAQTVDDNGLRAALAADTDAALLSALGLAKNGTSVEPGAASDPLAAAKARGEQAKRDILAAQGDMLSASDVASRLNVNVEDVERRRQDGLLIALPSETGTPGFPAWQFRDDGLLPGLDIVLSHMSVRSPWMRAQFFLSGDLRLDGRTPLDVLRRGEIDAVRRAGAAYGEQLAS